MDRTFVNLTNHPSARWCEAQRRAALEYGPIVDLPFPNVPEEASLAEVDELARSCLKTLRSAASPVVLVQGESVFTYRLVRLLEQAGIPALACVSRRRVRETCLPDGSTRKTAYYVFAGFRRYWE